MSKPMESALAHIHRTVLHKMGERLKARMPKQERKPDLPMNGEPEAHPAREHVEKLRALASRKG